MNKWHNSLGMFMSFQNYSSDTELLLFEVLENVRTCVRWDDPDRNPQICRKEKFSLQPVLRLSRRFQYVWTHTETETIDISQYNASMQCLVTINGWF